MHAFWKLSIVVLVVFILFPLVYGHGMEDEQDGIEEQRSKEEYRTAEQLIKTTIQYTIIGTIIVLFLIFISLFCKKTEMRRWFLFLGIAIPVILATLYSAGTTIYLNVVSETKGPVHWHADFEIWNCEEKVDLVDPSILTNRVGSAVFHEHGDDRIHVEGVVLDTREVDLQHFFAQVGSILREEYFVIPGNQGVVEMKNGQQCDGNPGKLQVFLYRVVNPEESKEQFLYEQIKLDDFEEYVLSPYSYIPPGDCLIIEFGQEKERTDKLCETYRIALQKGVLKEQEE